MSVLISRSDVIQILKECNLDETLFEKDVFDKINNLPMAYSVDKVVEELKCDRCESCNFLEVCAGSKCCGKCHEKAIEIVKQGGVSDDFCEWTQSGDMAISPHTFSKYKIKQCDGLYALSTCPYCGKKIKVVE